MNDAITSGVGLIPEFALGTAYDLQISFLKSLGVQALYLAP